MRPVLVLTLGVCLAAGSTAVAHAQAAATPADAPPMPHVRADTKALPGTRVDVYSTIRGNAFDAKNAGLSNSLVRLRDARMGKVIDTQVTDKAGAFAFFKVDPGYYLVELFDKSQQTLAASPLVSTGAGATAKTTVKLPVSSSLLASLMLGSQGSDATAATGLLPAITQLPQVILQAIPAIVPAGDPISER